MFAESRDRIFLFWKSDSFFSLVALTRRDAFYFMIRVLLGGLVS